MHTVGIVGYGEVGKILAEDLRARGLAVITHDLKLATGQRTPLVRHAEAHGVRLAGSHADLAAASDVVISAVTASQTGAAASACVPGLRPGTVYLDLTPPPRARRPRPPRSWTPRAPATSRPR